MIKNDLVDAVRDEIGGFSTKEIWTYVTFVFDEISSALERGENVKLTKFGTFEIHDKKARIGRNPKTLEEAIISARRAVKFKMSESVNNTLNPK
ncbi:MAG: integration host factor subunit alpha [Proteobacteria bacterium]|nr:integration host factor subunit alpha [Pseudomonadota bacterium]MBQ4360823.1 integration host factor subunit alpha [Pseudomonadota bacterium]